MIGIVCLLAGLACHLAAAQAIGGSFLAYRDHVLGFVLLTIVPGALIALVGRRFWRGRSDISLFVVGVLQVVMGIYVYIERFSVHG